MKGKLITQHDIKGKDFHYNGADYHVLAVENNGKKIVTNRRIFIFNTDEERDYFLAELTPIDSPTLPVGVASSHGVVVIKSDKDSEDMFCRILGQLEGDFERLAIEPGYAAQAAQRCNQVQTMTNLVKAKIELERHNFKSRQTNQR